MPQLDPETLPFAAQLIGVIFRVCGWGINRHTDPEMKESRNSEIKTHLTSCLTKLLTAPETKTIKMAEEGRLRFEGGNSNVVSVWVYMGDLKI